MKRAVLCAVCFLSVVIFGREKYYIREEFDSLALWKPLTFRNIDRHSRYSAVTEDGQTCLKAATAASASGIIYKKRFNVYRYPLMKWRWKISGVYTKGNATVKSGDDYPIRVYVVFKYDPGRASLPVRAKYGAVRLLYGEYPPHSSLSYIWANKKHKKRS